MATFMQYFDLVLRWLHLFFGVLWIGHLYYFNFTQGVYLNDAEVDAGAKTSLRRKLLPTALYYFRWGAMWTLVTGILLYGSLGHLNPDGFAGFMATGRGWAITVGVIMAITMWYNVWFVIWPNQQIVIKNAEGLAKGQPALPEAAAAGARANVASRTNTLFSIPVLFFMIGAKAIPLPPKSESSNYLIFWVVFLLIWGAIEFNALKGQTGKMMTTIRQTFHSGVGLLVVLVALMIFTA